MFKRTFNFPAFRKKSSDAVPALCRNFSFFTLIELLVVIAIIAILAAMLLPALQQARERGRSSMCISNMKQVAFCFSSYTDDFKGIIPPYRNNITVTADGLLKATSGRTWFSAHAASALLAQYVGMTVDYDLAFAGYGHDMSYQLRRHKLSCPSKDVDKNWLSRGNGIPGIGMNSSLSWGGSTAKARPQPIYKVRYPSRGCVTMEKYRTGYTLNYSHNIQTGSGATYAADYPHSDTSSVIFLDWHVKQMKRSQVPDQKINPRGAAEAAYTSFWAPFRANPYNGW